MTSQRADVRSEKRGDQVSPLGEWTPPFEDTGASNTKQ